jgi:Putative phage metallopeptidase
MKTYTPAPDALTCVENMLSEYHGELDRVTVGTLFIFDLDEEHEPCLKHQGYPAAAVIRITPLKDRALGVADAMIVVDRACWLSCTQPQRDALIDHELTHLERVLNPKTGKPRFDALSRPKLKMRRHDHQLGWFDEVAQRHADASPEIRQAQQLMAATGQLYLQFTFRASSRPVSGGFVPTKTGAQIDAEMRARHPNFNSETGEIDRSSEAVA